MINPSTNHAPDNHACWHCHCYSFTTYSLAPSSCSHCQPIRRTFVMGRGNTEYIKSDAVACKLRQKNSQHPRIKWSLATIHAIGEICWRLHPVAGIPLSLFKSPPFIAELVKHYNSTFLSGNIDLKLDRRNLWCIFFRREYRRKSKSRQFTFKKV